MIPLLKYVQKKYKETLNLDNKYRYEYASLRLCNIIDMINETNINFMDYSMATLSVQDMIFAILYVDHNCVVQYVCLGPPLQSMDGEYRRRFVAYEQLVEAYDQYFQIF